MRTSMILLCLLALNTANADTGLAFGNVMYHLFAGEPGLAYERALYFERRGVDAAVRQTLVLTRAGIALDLGLTDHAVSVIESVDESTLGSVDKARLSFLLARDAYDRQNWVRFDEALKMVDQKSEVLETPMGRYLQMEQARLANDFERATQLLNKADKRDSLTWYGLFNLGVSALARDERAVAERAFMTLLKWKPRNEEQVSLGERASIALANLGSVEQLSGVGADRQYGPAAVAWLAHEAGVASDHERASSLWHYLVTDKPWHPDALEAHVAYPYSLEQLNGPINALPAYEAAVIRLTERKHQLEAYVRELASLDNSDAALALGVWQLSGQAPGLITTLQDVLGHDDWTNWLADRESQQLVGQVVRLDRALTSLRQRRRDMEILLAVDREQQRRIAYIAGRAHTGAHQERIAALHEEIQRQERELAAGRSSPAFDDHILSFANEQEKSMLLELEQMSSVVSKGSEKADEASRIARLKGLVLFRLFDDLPVRIREREAELDQLHQSVASAQGQLDRINIAEAGLGSATSVSGRIAQLSVRTDDYLARTELALRDSGSLLMAKLQAGIETELASIEEQRVYVNLAIARISDQRLLTAEAGQ